MRLPLTWPKLVGFGALMGALALLCLGPLMPLNLFRPSTTLAAAFGAGPLLVFSELRGAESVLWAADPGDPARRWRLGSVPHREGYGPRAAVAPDGSFLALTLLPPDGHDVEEDGQLWLVEVGAPTGRMALDGVNARGTPVWSPDSRFLAVKRRVPEGPQLVILDVASGLVASSVLDAEATDLFPVGWTPSGESFYVATQTPRGYDLKAFEGTSPAMLRHIVVLAAGPARDFRLAPDGQRLTYLSFGMAGLGDDPTSVVLDVLRSGPGLFQAQRRPVGTGPVLGAVWHPLDAGLTLAQLGAGAGTRLHTWSEDTATLSTLQGPGSGGYDVPLRWSPDGRALAVRHLDGPDLQRLHGERLDLLTPEGHRTTIAAAGPVSFAGWLPGRGP